MRPAALLAFAALSLARPTVVQAQDRGAEEQDAEEIFSVDAAVTLVSDYRFRGLSSSDKDPALQPELTIAHASGFYAGFWASTIAGNEGADIEFDPGIGFATRVGMFELDVSATWYLYPGARGLDYVELVSTATLPIGEASIGASVGYAPAQDNIGGSDNLYLAAQGSVPIGAAPVTLTGHFGVEDGAFGDRKLDWSVGLAGEVAGVELGAAYVDAARTGRDPLADAGVVLSVSKSF